jgi:MSHA biogenesis protein MshL
MTVCLQKPMPDTRSDDSTERTIQAIVRRFFRSQALKYFSAAIFLIVGFAMDLQPGQANSLLESAPDKPRFTLNLKDVHLREALMLLTKNSTYSLIIDPGIDGVLPVLDLKEMTLEETLQSVLPGLGLEYRIEGKILRVGKPGMQTRIFNINLLAASRSGKREMRMSSRSQGGGGNSGGGGSSGSSGGSGQSGSGSEGGSSSENDSTISTANTSAIWMDLKLGLESLIFQGLDIRASNRPEESGPVTSANQDAAGRRLLINPQAGFIMIHAEPGALEEAARYIEAVENSAQRQVLIEARVVEVTLSKDNQLGVNWSAILNPTSGFSGLLSSSLGVSKPSISLNTGNVTNQNVNPSMGQAQYSISNGKVGAVIDALSRQGQLRVLSSPHISTMNNQKAVIRVVREEVFFTQTSLVSQSVGPTVTTENVQNQIVPIGVVLDIIPQIASDGEITLSINPSISELAEVRTFSSNDGNALSTQPVIDRRDLDTVAKVHSGETILIAGIIKERKSEDLRGFPLLMHIPILGNAFRRTEQSTARTELVIFITPTLIDKKSMAAINEEENRRLKEMEQPFKLKTTKPEGQSMPNESHPQ